jgi:hypothetical protein
MIQYLSQIIQQESNAAIHPPGSICIVRQVLDERHAHSGRVQSLVRPPLGVVAQLVTEAVRLLVLMRDHKEKTAVPHPQLERI